MTTVNGWTLLFHPLICRQLIKVDEAAGKARKKGASNANVKLFDMMSKVIYERIPADPAADEFRQGNTLGPKYRHWRRAKFGGRFRLYFRFDSRSRIIILAWVNDEKSQRKQGAKSDPYQVFKAMLNAGNPPDDFPALAAACEKNWQEGG